MVLQGKRIVSRALFNYIREKKDIIVGNNEAKIIQ